MITINNLKYSYKRNSSFLKIDELNFSSGNIYGIFGPNGCGKTTLLKIITNVINNYDGRVKVEDKISYLPDDHPYLTWMSIDDIIEFYSDFYQDFNLKRFSELLPKYNGSKLIKDLSKGQKESLFISLVFARNTEIYVMDEPFGALDLKKQDFYIKKIIDIIGEDKLLIMTTHYPYDIQNLFSKSLFMKDGQIIANHDVKNYDYIVEQYKKEVENGEID